MQITAVERASIARDTAISELVRENDLAVRATLAKQDSDSRDWRERMARETPTKTDLRETEIRIMEAIRDPRRAGSHRAS